MSRDELTGRVALVTGGAAGIGYAICALLQLRGARVVVADQDAAAAERAAVELGPGATAVGCDVRRAADLESAFALAAERFGPVDILINNAGITRDAMLHNLSEQHWDEVLEVNLKGAFFATQTYARQVRSLPAQLTGRAIVNIASLAAKNGNMGQANYVAAKAGLVGLTRTAARELARYHVRVNAVQPGFIDTAMTRAIPEEVKAQRLAEIPLARAGTVDEVARTVGFLASEEASYLTGIVIDVAGGRSM